MSTLLELGRQGQPLSAWEIHDVHGHIGLYSFGIPDTSLRSMIEVMDRVGVAATWISHMHCMSADTEYGNEEVWKAMKAYPGRLLGYASFWPTDAAAVRESATRWLDRGFIGLKLHNSNGFSYMDAAFQPAYALANERCMPVLLHTWGGEAEFAQVREAARVYPNLSFLLAHSGSANEKGYIQIAKELPNVYLETAFSRSPPGLVERLVQGVGADRVVWGSDNYFLCMTQQVGRVLGAALSDDDKLALLSGNARRILGRVKR